MKMPYYTNQQGKQLFYEDKGNGEAFVFLHPPGMGRKVFKMQHDLAEKYRVIFPDLSGNGDSETVTKQPDVAFYADEIIELMDRLKLDQVIPVGYSCGGMIAQELALRHANRVKGVVLAGGFPKVNTGMLHFEFSAGMRWVEQSPETLAKLLSQSHFRSIDYKRELCEHMAKSDPEVWHAYYHECLQHDCTERLPQLKVPLLLAYGAKEFWINHHSMFYRDCPDVTFGLIERAYHQIPATHAPQFHEMIDRFVRTKVEK
ncbi:alpha/beta hydrolase [Halobacillus litoralis]|uniref:alpha/beta fold hydrolase n=1 Tax=Halobacillus litoralis TaxID=45668 RepID=UPI001CD450CA|nr:alpha/beta hydrolase [Halobacillus litoralis]MCA0972548.1 alpha/beta hydrolase [Halobacillus litoralis]